WFYAMRHIDVSVASSIAVPSPVLTMVLAIVFLGDRVEPYQVAALAVVIASLYGLLLAGMRKRRREGA
ncbi:MAG: EamA family transporter, partial [Rhodospirillaceae bacterium]|nr:EamA family transporter [Rhodospirillaceae bacterium]